MISGHVSPVRLTVDSIFICYRELGLHIAYGWIAVSALGVVVSR
jgi:hypothetical protein